MQRTESPLIVIAVCLASLAGFVDALAFTSLGGFFASFMSGNSTRLGVGLGTGDASAALTAGALVMSFIAGVILSSVIVRAAPGRGMVGAMLAATILLLLAAGLASVAPGPIVLLLLAGAMGAVHGMSDQDGETAIGLTAMSGALVRVGRKLASALMGDPDRWAWVPHLALWTGFLSGVVFGAAGHMRWGWGALWIAPVVSAVLTAAIAGTARRRPGGAQPAE